MTEFLPDRRHCVERTVECVTLCTILIGEGLLAVAIDFAIDFDLFAFFRRHIA